MVVCGAGGGSRMLVVVAVVVEVMSGCDVKTIVLYYLSVVWVDFKCSREVLQSIQMLAKTIASTASTLI